MLSPGTRVDRARSGFHRGNRAQYRASLKPAYAKESGRAVFCLLRRDGRDAEADVIRPSLGLEPLPEGAPGGPTGVAPGAAPAGSRERAVTVRCSPHRGEIGVCAARQPRVVPVATPLDDVTVHVAQA